MVVQLREYMKRPVNDNLVVKNGLEDFIGQQYVDIHCHCLPAIDDGPAAMSDAIDLCRALVTDGASTVIATPHQLGRFNDCNHSGQVRQAVAALNEELKNNNIYLSIVPGGDVRVDERISSLLKTDEILTLADGGKYILLELPHRSFIDIEPLLIELDVLGIQSIISHPERHLELSRRPEILLKWLERSAHVQITTSSLLGKFGSRIQKSAWQLLSSGAAAIVATDSHNLTDRRPCMNAAFQQISLKLGPHIAHLVCIDNPLRILNGQDVVPIDNARASSYK
jgi:protein-tyrosine phosphatase